MKTKMHATILTGVLLLLIFSGFLLIKNFNEDPNEPTRKTSAIYFLQSQGEIHSSPDEQIPLDLFFYADGNRSYLDDKENKPIVQIDCRNLAIVDYSIEAGDVYKEMRLYSVHLSLQADQPGQQTITQVTIEDDTGKMKTYPIGRVNVNIEKTPTENLLEIFEHTGTATLGAPYLFTLKNESPQTCTVLEIDLGSLSSFVNELRTYLNGEQVEIGTGIIAKQGDELSVEADFKTTAGNDIYYVSPKVYYEIQSTQNGKTKYSYSLPHATFGIPITGNRVKEIYWNHFH